MRKVLYYAIFLVVASFIQLGGGPGPVVQTSFPSSSEHYPALALDPMQTSPPSFLKMGSTSGLQNCNHDQTQRYDNVLGTVLPIVENVEWVERLCNVSGMTDIQLRIKGVSDDKTISRIVLKCQEICIRSGVRLWINDHWRHAIRAKCFGVHLGQEDLARCVKEGGLEKIRQNNMALGISTHSYAELSTAIGMKPSYISLGPVFGTASKNVAFDPQGLSTVKKWRDLIESNIPLVAIGGINDSDSAEKVKKSGADCIAVIGALTKASDVDLAFKQLTEAMRGQNNR